MFASIVSSSSILAVVTGMLVSSDVDVGLGDEFSLLSVLTPMVVVSVLKLTFS